MVHHGSGPQNSKSLPLVPAIYIHILGFWGSCFSTGAKASTINEPHLPTQKAGCYAKSPTAQDMFQLIPGLIGCMTGSESQGTNS